MEAKVYIQRHSMNYKELTRAQVFASILVLYLDVFGDFGCVTLIFPDM